MEAPGSEQRPDGELLAEFATRRQEAAFAELVRRHGGTVLSVCRSVLGNTSDAEDAAQAVFLTLAQKAHSSSVQSHLVGWLHRVAWYVARRASDGRAIRRRHEQEAARMRQETCPHEEDFLQLDVLHAGLARLPEKYREPLILHHLEGRSHAETAAVVGCSAEAVAVRLHRGREMLRQRLAKMGVVTSVAGLAGAWGVPAMAQMSPLFVASTARAATAVLAGSAASAAGVSGQVMALSNGAIKMLFWAKTKVVATVVALVLLTGGAVGTVLRANTSAPPRPSAITGVISQVQAGQITLQRRTGPVTVAIDEATIIKVDDKVVTAAELKVGMSSVAFVPEGKPATEVRATSAKPAPAPPTTRARVVTGSLSQVGAGSLVIQPQNGPAVTVTLDAATVVQVNDKPASARDLQVEMSVGAFFVTGQPATEIRAYTPGTLPSR